jgi:hypothetical protein
LLHVDLSLRAFVNGNVAAGSQTGAKVQKPESIFLRLSSIDSNMADKS